MRPSLFASSERQAKRERLHDGHAMRPTQDELIAFLANVFPQNPCTVQTLTPEGAIVSYQVSERDLRPGGTISGPSMFLVADVALYVAILSRVGLVPLAVTTDLSIHFLRKPVAHAALRGECRLIKLGRSLATGDVLIYSEGRDAPVAHAVGSYAIPAAG